MPPSPYSSPPRGDWEGVLCIRHFLTPKGGRGLKKETRRSRDEPPFYLTDEYIRLSASRLIESRAPPPSKCIHHWSHNTLFSFKSSAKVRIFFQTAKFFGIFFTFFCRFLQKGISEHSSEWASGEGIARDEAQEKLRDVGNKTA